ncbi:PIN domain-containing protein [Nonomuraea sp. NPDC046802]|uniref:PIN domain-containing protein n=1 Tax=Nonomuraea sp. NPDC046802 TaxID=3154919 RepID=UPI0033F214DE
MVVKLPPGGNRENALKELRKVHEAVIEMLRQTEDSSYHPQQLLAVYLQWVDRAVYRLRYHISATDLDDLVLSRRYWVLQAMEPSTLPPDRLRDFVVTELEERETAVGLAAQRLAEQIERWMRPGAFVMFDTSVFVHHAEKLENIDLGGILGSRHEPVHLLVPMVVIDELDKLKESKDRHARWRARHSLAVLDKLLTHPAQAARLRPADYTPQDSGGIPRGEVTVEVVLDPPGHARLPIEDDEIVDQAVTAQVLAGRPVTLVTFDTGQSMRARAAGLRCMKIEQPPEGPPPSPENGGRR